LSGRSTLPMYSTSARVIAEQGVASQGVLTGRASICGEAEVGHPPGTGVLGENCKRNENRPEHQHAALEDS
jgi:hypothetical protein